MLFSLMLPRGTRFCVAPTSTLPGGPDVGGGGAALFSSPVALRGILRFGRPTFDLVSPTTLAALLFWSLRTDFDLVGGLFPFRSEAGFGVFAGRLVLCGEVFADESDDEVVEAANPEAIGGSFSASALNLAAFSVFPCCSSSFAHVS